MHRLLSGLALPLLAAAAAAAPLVTTGCGEVFDGRLDARFDAAGEPTDPDDLALRHRIFLLDPPATVDVEGVGPVDIEATYVPGVVACENGNAPLEALKAQAVQARSYLFYYLAANPGEAIPNSQAAQVFSCGHVPNGPGPLHKQAAAETRGEYLEYQGTIVAAFYVAGAIPSDPDPADPVGSCLGRATDSDPTNTERWVTYNWQKSGCDIDQTPLGWIPEDCLSNKANRGCASQNGESCLAQVGWGYQEMLNYYYGADIELHVAGEAPPPEERTEYDLFCETRADGDYCFDATTSVTCAASYASIATTCDEACGADGQCSETPPTGDDRCEELPDGDHCVGGFTRITCASGEQTASRDCPHGCAAGYCLVDASNNGGANNGGVNNGGANNGGTNGPGGPPSFPDLVDVSPGLEGGCTTASGAPGGPGASWLLTLVGLVGMRLRRRRD